MASIDPVDVYIGLTPSGEPEISTFPVSEDGTVRSHITLDYLAEGGANIVYIVQPANGKALHDMHAEHLDGRLLRLRKDVKHYIRTSYVLKEFNDTIRPLFPKWEEQLVDQTLVHISKDVLRLCNEALDGYSRVLEDERREEQEQTRADLLRPKRFLHTRLEIAEPHGLLITSMLATPQLPVALEIKPKWLVDSPHAPAHSVRCRTCATRLWKAQKDHKPLHSSGFCPLALASGQEEFVRAAIRGNLEEMMPESIAEDSRDALEHRLTSFFTNGKGAELIRTLKNLQERYDVDYYPATTTEVDQSHPQDQLLGLAMTLRDCAVFVRCSALTIAPDGDQQDDAIEARVADLDVKHGEKLPVWRDMEEELQEEGWYAGRKASSDVKEVCVKSTLNPSGKGQLSWKT